MTMHALHQTLLPPSAIHHSLYVAHFTPSTIYPFPSPASSPVKVVGNLVVAGGQDLRVFEIREQTEIDQGALGPIDTVEDEHRGEQQRDPALDDGFFDSEPPHVSRHFLLWTFQLLGSTRSITLPEPSPTFCVPHPSLSHTDVYSANL